MIDGILYFRMPNTQDSRNTQGVRAINVAEDDRVASVERMIDGKLPAEEVVP